MLKAVVIASAAAVLGLASMYFDAYLVVNAADVPLALELWLTYLPSHTLALLDLSSKDTVLTVVATVLGLQYVVVLWAAARVAQALTGPGACAGSLSGRALIEA